MEKTLTSKLILRGRNFSFYTDEVELSNGRRTQRDVVRHPGSVAIIPVLPDGRVVMVRQYRYAAGKTLLEIPAGTMELDESPLKCAYRELREETGYEAGEMEKVLSCFIAPGYSSEVIHFYVARNLREVGGDQEQDEDISVERYDPKKILEMIRENTVDDAKTIIGLVYLDLKED